MTLSPALLDFFIEQTGLEVTGDAPVGGGCINNTFQVTLQDGSRYFVKQNNISLRDMFEKEAAGLHLLANAAGGDSGSGEHGKSGDSGEIRIPEVTGLTEDHETGQAFLILSFVDEGRRGGDFDRRFGRALAGLHRNRNRQYGLDHDNYIGRLPQKNDWRDNWSRFFMECRLEPQFAMARERGFFNGAARQSLDRLGNSLPDLLPEEPPSLLHGDLWGGNYLCDRQNRPVLIDPAVYYGHREAELAFTTLFGGFGRDFYSGYEESWPLQPGFSNRRDIYNLYPLLVHVNLFGGMYVTQTESILRRF